MVALAVTTETDHKTEEDQTPRRIKKGSLRTVLRALLSIMKVMEKTKCTCGGCIFSLCYKESSNSWYFLAYSSQLDICEAHILLEDGLDQVDWQDANQRQVVREAFLATLSRWRTSHRTLHSLGKDSCQAVCLRQEGVS